MYRFVLAVLVLATTLLLGACATSNPLEQERRAVYEQQKQREAAERSQREADAASRRLDRAINK